MLLCTLGSAQAFLQLAACRFQLTPGKADNSITPLPGVSLGKSWGEFRFAFENRARGFDAAAFVGEMSGEYFDIPIRSGVRSTAYASFHESATNFCLNNFTLRKSTLSFQTTISKLPNRHKTVQINSSLESYTACCSGFFQHLSKVWRLPT